MSRKKPKTSAAQNFKQDPTVYYLPPVLKDSFKGVYKILKKNKVSKVVDIGCASGDFLYYLPKNIQGLGLDASAALISTAKKRVSRDNVRFLKADALRLTSKVTAGFTGADTAVTLLGILHTFLDFRPLLDAALKFNPRLIVIHSPFSEAPVDSYHYHKLAADPKARYQCGYSFFSKYTLGRELEKRGLRNYQFVPFVMTRKLSRDPGNPIRNYHLDDSAGRRFLTNGINLLFTEYFLVIKR